MRNLFFLLCLTGLTGCGVVRDIAADTCSRGSSYNVAVCPNILDKFVEDTTTSSCRVEGGVKTFPSGKVFEGTLTGCSAREREEALKRLLR
jgi:hypothetical protein